MNVSLADGSFAELELLILGAGCLTRGGFKIGKLEEMQGR